VDILPVENSQYRSNTPPQLLPSRRPFAIVCQRFPGLWRDADADAVAAVLADRGADVPPLTATPDRLPSTTAHRAQADALEIEAAAKRRLADEYDAAQERGEVATRQNNPGSVGHVPGQNMPPATAADIGLSRKDIHEARQIRDAEAAEPGLVRRTLDARLAAGAEPSKAAVRRGYCRANGHSR
jgi:hypothetical protein